MGRGPCQAAKAPCDGQRSSPAHVDLLPFCDYVLVSEMIVGDGSSTFLEMQKARFFATLSVYSASNKRVAESCASLD